MEPLRVVAAEVDQHLLDGLGLDSLDLLELAVRCEDEFGRSIPDAELVRWGRPRDVVRYLLAVEPAASDVA